MNTSESARTERPWRVYWRATVASVLQPFLVDAVIVAIIVAVLWGTARLLILLAAKRCGITPAHVDHATALLGLLYVVAMLGTVTRRLYYNVFKNTGLPRQSPEGGGVVEETETSA